MTKNERLAEAIKEETKNLPAVDGFGNDNDHVGADAAVEYLLTGKVPEGMDPDDHDTLYAAMYDLNTLFSDYGIEDE